jgi:hypothetical protein
VTPNATATGSPHDLGDGARVPLPGSVRLVPRSVRCVQLLTCRRRATSPVIGPSLRTVARPDVDGPIRFGGSQHFRR